MEMLWQIFWVSERQLNFLLFITSELNEFESVKFGDFYSTLLLCRLFYFIPRLIFRFGKATRKGGNNYGFYTKFSWNWMTIGHVKFQRRICVHVEYVNRMNFSCKN